MIGKPGPFQVIDNEGHFNPGAPVSSSCPAPICPPRRRYDCPHYEECLDLAAALNWDSFTCRGCSGEIDGSLYWRAHQMEKRDRLVGIICSLPSLKARPARDTELVPIRRRAAAK